MYIFDKNLLMIFFITISSVLVLLFTPVLIKLAKIFNITDIPDGILKKHKMATPYLGGVAIFIGIIPVSIYVLICDYKIAYVFIALISILFLGLKDDLRPLSPGQKFLGQLFIAIILVFCGLKLKASIFSNFVNIILSVFWITSLVNAFNLIDVMDGLCATIAYFSALNFLFFIYNQSILLLFNLSFMSSLSAFWIFNKPSAKIYLGDSGSMLIGLYFSIMSLMINWDDFGKFGFIYPILILIIPLMELGWLIFIRTYKGIPFYKGSPDHFSIYLQNFEWTKNKILFFVAILNLFLTIIFLFY